MWLHDLAKVRRFLRDPDGNIWAEPFLRHLWNDVQNDFQNRTGVLEDVVAQRIPDIYHMSFMHDWEWSYLPSQYSEFYQCLSRHDDQVFCHWWEPQQITQITPDVTDDGVHFTQPWEAFMGMIPSEEVRMKFPKNYAAVKFMAYDEEPVYPSSRKAVQSSDTSYLSTSGNPLVYYIHESMDKSYVLYPRPSTAFIDEVIGEGIAFFAEDDTEDASVGIIAVRTGSAETSNIGASVDVIGVQNNILLAYDVAPTDITTVSDEPDFPEYLRKYIRYGVIGRAYGANSDGRIQSLSKLWMARYELGIKVVKRFINNRRQDRDYRLTTKPSRAVHHRRLPRLPSTYPHVQ